ncbi:MAG: energy-coupling factor transporter ATPase [Firmicutes bacterium]|nr:energy-coupling factor transporter ATPase [Bacillota bacterium]
MGIITFNNVSYTYNAGTEDAVSAVKGVSFEINEGEFVALAGHNGSGKSTLAKLANGLLLPRKGRVTVDGIDTFDKKRIFDVRRTAGVVFQNPDNQMVASIIEDDVAFGPENIGLAPREIRARVDWALDAVGMRAYAKATPFRLSGGQKQRVAIAGVLALKPRVMILDESTAMLDPIGREEVMTVIKKLNRDENVTIVLITHFMEEAAQADRIIVLNDGKIALSGGREIFSRADELAAIGLDVPLPSRIARRLQENGLELPDGIVTQDDLINALEVCAKKCP